MKSLMVRTLDMVSDPGPVSKISLCINLILLFLFWFGGIADELQRDLIMIAIAITWGGWIGIDIDRIVAMRGGDEDV